MSDLRTTQRGDLVEVSLDEASFPRDAVYAAAFSFIDRCYVRLDRIDGGRLGVVLRGKPGGTGSFDGDALAGELRDELLAQTFRHRLAESGRRITDMINATAFGDGVSAPGEDRPPGGDAFPADLAEAPFDDPLGIAQSWEEKHAREPHEGSAQHEERGEPRT